MSPLTTALLRFTVLLSDCFGVTNETAELRPVDEERFACAFSRSCSAI